MHVHAQLMSQPWIVLVALVGARLAHAGHEYVMNLIACLNAEGGTTLEAAFVQNP